jgi:multidrug efflux pump subunit AcrA (membrane-fusion protein)
MVKDLMLIAEKTSKLMVTAVVNSQALSGIKARTLALSAAKAYDLLIPSNNTIAPTSPMIATGRVIRFGMLASLAAIIVFLIGGSLAPLESASVLQGAIMPSGYKKTVQHLEGGIVDAILVKDGDQVTEGQPLVRLSKIGATASREGLQSSLQSTQTQLDYVNETLVTEMSLVEQGLSTRPRLLALKGQAAALEGKIGELRAAIHKDEDILDRTVITAPIAGTVNDLKYHTAGGIIPPGGALMDIVPQDGSLLVDAQIQPRDISRVHIGQDAKVMFSTYKSRITPMIMGKVVQVSADRIMPPASANIPALAGGYYLARVEVEKADMQKLVIPITLTPGMPVEVMAVDSKRSLLGYYLKPFFDSFHRAFREQ